MMGRIGSVLGLVCVLLVTGCGDSGGGGAIGLTVGDGHGTDRGDGSGGPASDVAQRDISVDVAPRADIAAPTADVGPDLPDPVIGCLAIDQVVADAYPPAGLRVTFRVLDCDGGAVAALSPADLTVRDDATGAAFAAGAVGPVALGDSRYAVGICTSVSSGAASATLVVEVGGAQASATFYYDTTVLSGDTSGCDPASFADPCAGRVCGAGTVAGFACGSCDACGTVCSGAGQCEFTACDGKVCGSDGCGATCGECDGVCSEGQCYTPCAGRECGDDGFGGTCGSCDTYGVCNVDGQCEYPTWADPTSGLTWQNADFSPKLKWGQAAGFCSGLSLGGFSDWRVPTIDEQRSLVRGCPDTEPGGTCPRTTACPEDCWANECYGCDNDAGPAEGCYWPAELRGDCTYYWNTSLTSGGLFGGYINYKNSSLGSWNVDLTQRLRCVR